MTATNPLRRRAEEFDRLIDSGADVDASRFAVLSPALLALAELHDEPLARPRSEFSSDFRTKLMAAAQVAQAALTSDTPAEAAARQPTPVRSGRERKIAAALAGFAIVSATGSMAFAAQSALPGDKLYPLKRALENVHVEVQSGDDKGATLLANASGRLEEVDALSRGGHDPQAIAQTLQDFSDQASQASQVLLDDYRANGNLDSLQQLRAFTASSLEELRYLQGVVPASARAQLIAASNMLAAIDQKAMDACPDCAATVPAVAISSQLPTIDQPSSSASGRPTKTAPARHAHHGSKKAGSGKDDQQAPPSGDDGTDSSPQSDPSGGPLGDSSSDPGSSSGSGSTSGDAGDDDPLGTITGPLGQVGGQGTGNGTGGGTGTGGGGKGGSDGSDDPTGLGLGGLPGLHRPAG